MKNYALTLIFVIFVGCGDTKDIQSMNQTETNKRNTEVVTAANLQGEVSLSNNEKQIPDKKQICMDDIEKQKQIYNKLYNERQYLEAANTVRQCAKELQDLELLNLVTEADIQHYCVQADDTNSSIPLRLRAMNQLIAEYPKVGEKYKKIRDELEEFVYSKWEYVTVEDPMTSRKTQVAKIESTNEIFLDSPYEGAQKGTLQLRVHPRFGKDVIIRVKEGQIMCSSYRGCNALVRFDDNEPQKYSAAESNDSDPTILFLNNYDRFVNNLLKSKRVLISLEFYQNGLQILEFNVAGFDKQKYPIQTNKKSKK